MIDTGSPSSPSQYFMRVRGRVLGPYDREKLQQLVRRGQLGRMHELSTDGISWSRATAFPELFEAPEAPPAVAEQPVALREAPQPPAIPDGAGKWYYTAGGNQFGPVDFVQLQLLATTGQLGADEQVWSEGMVAWTAVRDLPGLKTPTMPNFATASAATAAGSHATPVADMAELPSALCKSASASRPWVMFLSITAFVYSGLSILGGLIVLVEGANKNQAAMVATGLFNLVYAVITLVGAFLLLAYANHLERLKHLPAPPVLEKAMDAVRAFWIYLSIVMIVMLAFVVCLSIWLIAISGTLSW